MKRYFRSSEFAIALVLLALVLLAPLYLSSTFHLRIVSLILVFATIGFAFNLMFGIAGQLILGLQGFFAIGGYSLVLLQLRADMPLVAAAPLALLISGLAGLLIGLPLMRLRSHYLAMATLMFGFIVEGLALRMFDLTNGSAGIRLPRPEILGWVPDRIELFYIVAGIAILAFILHAFLSHSYIGRAFHVIRADEFAATSVGIDVSRYKLWLFVIGGGFAGLAGIASALVNRQVDPSYSSLHINITLLTLAVIGGLRSTVGPVLGAIVVIALPQVLTAVNEYETMLFGGVLLLSLIFLPKGIAGLLETAFARLSALGGHSERAASRSPAITGEGGK